jgi:Dynamin family
MNLQWAHL